MNEQGIQPAKWWPFIKSEQAKRWLALLVDKIQRVETYQESLNVTSVPANSEAIQTFTITGLTAEDLMTVNKQSNTAGLDLVQAWASANTLHLKFRNHTGSAIDPAAENYLIQANRR